MYVTSVNRVRFSGSLLCLSRRFQAYYLSVFVKTYLFAWKLSLCMLG